jgi:hypothetical protein
MLRCSRECDRRTTTTISKFKGRRTRRRRSRRRRGARKRRRLPRTRNG